VKTDRAESVVQVLILIAIAGMAGAASFTHVHDWTMKNAPSGTGSWFGWANAIISELTPTAAGIEIRKRRRKDQPIGYPLFLIVAAAILSLSAQVAEAQHSFGGWISSAVPALAFLALTKLILSSPHGSKEAPAPVMPVKSPSPASPVAPPPSKTAPAQAATTSDAFRDLRPVPSGQLLISARMTAFAHQQETGQPITPGQLADRLTIPVPLAGSLLDHLGGTTTAPPVTAVNGTPARAEGQP